MNEEIRNTKYWSYVKDFVQKNIVLQKEGYIILGYFPYHTAIIRLRLHKTYNKVPRTFLKDFEEILLKHRIMDNKAVYICECMDVKCRWAVMLKDDYALIGRWEEVFYYDNKSLVLKP